MKKLIDLINEEDIKNPLTDLEIAKIMDISRAEVIKIRHSAKIEDSRKRRNDILEKSIKSLIQKYPNISNRAITSKLNENGFRVSRNVISKFMNDEIELEVQISNTKDTDDNIKIITDSQDDKSKEDHNEDAFSTLIGSNGSLKPKIELAKAAILYPPKGLHTLIYGTTGVGKSELAECMYKFSLESGAKKSNAPFVVFNCADYADNPQLLLSQLFGYAKGAFTGADADKQGLVEKANNGILFLDEIHRLPPEGQETLFYLIDKGKFRRLGESDTLRTANIMIIGATSEKLESALLATFIRRIPMTIELPELNKRPLKERFDIIVAFLKQEATKVNVKIIVSLNVIEALLLYDLKGNVGQLRSDIQVACARGFLGYISKKKDFMNIDIVHISGEVAKGMLNINKNRKNIESFIEEDLEIKPYDGYRDDTVINTSYLMPTDIYKDIEDRYQKLEAQNMDSHLINQLIGDELERKIQQVVKKVKGNRHNLIRNDLEKIVGHKIIYAVDNMMKEINDNPEYKDETLYYCLATHLSAAYERLMQNKFIHNPQLKEIKEEYPEKYTLAKKMGGIASGCLNIQLPEDEIAFIAMYLKAYSKKDDLLNKYVGVVVLSHGHVAEALVNVASRLLGENHAYAIDMSFDESPQQALDRTENIVKNSNLGRGVLLLVDMGSLMSFGKIISEKTGIPIRTCNRVDTIMVIEAIRKSMLPDESLDEIADSLEKSMYNYEFEIIEEKRKNRVKPVIIFTCLTGIGTAKALMETVINKMPSLNERVEMICKGSLSENVSKDIHKILHEKNIIAVIGTFNLKIKNIPFISATEIINEKGLGILQNIVNEKVGIYNSKEGSPVLNNLIDDQLIFIDIPTKNKTKILSNVLCEMEKLGYITTKYKKSVFDREKLAPTLLNKNIAIPHGNPSEVNKHGIAIIKLDSPIEWSDGNMIEIIFLLALKEYDREMFLRIYNFAENARNIQKIKLCKTKDDIKEVFLGENRI